MKTSIPLIRAAALRPIRRWLAETGRDPRPFLREADLAWVPEDAPKIPIPVHNAARLLRALAQAEGPDVPFRIVDHRTGVEIGMIGAAALQAETLRAGFHQIAERMHRHCTHELFIAEDADGALRIGEGWIARLGDDETQHLVQQYVVAIVNAVCSLAAGPAPCVSRVALLPHPGVGIAHLRPWLGDRVHPNGRRMLEIEIDDPVADRPIPAVVRQRAARVMLDDWPPLADGNGLGASVAALVASMLPRSAPSIDRVAMAARLSPRTLQRALRDEGTSLSEIVERTRARLALDRLGQPDAPRLKDLAAELGYANPGTLTRAVRRWTGAPPSALRRPGPGPRRPGRKPE